MAPAQVRSERLDTHVHLLAPSLPPVYGVTSELCDHSRGHAIRIPDNPEKTLRGKAMTTFPLHCKEGLFLLPLAGPHLLLSEATNRGAHSTPSCTLEGDAPDAVCQLLRYLLQGCRLVSMQ